MLIKEKNGFQDTLKSFLLFVLRAYTYTYIHLINIPGFHVCCIWSYE